MKQNELWQEISEFPLYLVSNQGRIKNYRTDRFKIPAINDQGILSVSLMNDRVQHRRSVVLLVAQNFLPPDPMDKMGRFDTPIHLDGDKLNCNVENLAWRARWFAVRFHRQFSNPHQIRYDTPVRDVKSGEVFSGSLEIAHQFGLIERDVCLSIMKRTFVMPTYQRFELIE